MTLVGTILKFPGVYSTNIDRVFTGRNEVVAKVIFLHLSVIHSVHRGGVGLPQCMLGYHPPPREQTPHPRTTPPRPPPTPHPPEQTPPGTTTPHPPTTPPTTPPDHTPPPTPAYGLRATGTHPTGMHSCFFFSCKRGYLRISDSESCSTDVEWLPPTTLCGHYERGQVSGVASSFYIVDIKKEAS